MVCDTGKYSVAGFRQGWIQVLAVLWECCVCLLWGFLRQALLLGVTKMLVPAPPKNSRLASLPLNNWIPSGMSIFQAGSHWLA